MDTLTLILNTKIEDTDLHETTKKALLERRIDTVADLATVRRESLYSIKGYGKKAETQVLELLQGFGLTFGMNEKDILNIKYMDGYIDTDAGSGWISTSINNSTVNIQLYLEDKEHNGLELEDGYAPLYLSALKSIKGYVGLFNKLPSIGERLWVGVEDDEAMIAIQKWGNIFEVLYPIFDINDGLVNFRLRQDG